LSRIDPENENAHDAFVRVLRNENLRNAGDLVVEVNWFQGSEPRNTFEVYLLGEKTKKANVLKPVRVFLLPATLGRVHWSEDGRQITFCDGLQPVGAWGPGGSALRFTYDLRGRCWVRIVDPRPGVWKPPATPDRTMISFPPDRSLCKDL